MKAILLLLSTLVVAVKSAAVRFIDEKGPEMMLFDPIRLSFIVHFGRLIHSFYTQIFESTALMTLSFEKTQDSLTTSSIYQLEQVTADYLSQQLQLSFDDDNVLRVTVATRQTSPRMERVALEFVISAYYIAYATIDLDMIWRRNAIVEDKLEGLKKRTLSILGENARLEATFVPFEEPTVVTEVNLDEGRIPADKGLIAAVCVLAALLLIVSSTLLHVTGGWNACQQKCSNCLFEEIDDDNEDDYQVAKKSTFQVQSFDEESQMSASMATNPTGVLGATETMDSADPTAGMGIKTPARSDYDSDDMGTPMSDMTSAEPLGITSMRKLPPPDSSEGQEDKGLASMILDRLNQYNK